MQGLPQFLISGLPDAACKQSPDRIKAAAANSGVPVPNRRLDRQPLAGVDAQGRQRLRPADRHRRARRGGSGPGAGRGADGAHRRAGPGRLGAAGARGAAGRAGRGPARRRRPWWCRPTTRPRRRSCPGCGCCPRGTWPSWSAATACWARAGCRRTSRSWQRRSASRRRCPTCATSWARTRRAWRSRSRRRAGTTCSWSVRRAPARRCWPSGCPGCCRPSEPGHALEVTAIQSLLGVLPRSGALVSRPPFVAPHHGASMAAIIGGGSGFIRPGAISRAHRGVLFLDEAPEFKQSVLQALRQPAESGEVTIARASGVGPLPGPVPARARRQPVPVRPRVRQGGRLLLLADGRGATTWASWSGRCSTGSTCSSRCTPSAGPRWPSRPGRGARSWPRGCCGPARSQAERLAGAPVAGQRRGARADDAPQRRSGCRARRPPTSTGRSSGAR